MFTITKLIFIFRFGSLSTFIDYSGDIPHLIFNSLRFDLQSIAYLLLFIFIINFVFFFSNTEKVIKTINKISVAYISIIFTFALFLLIADQQFYSFFKLHFNSVVFDFFDEEPKLLMKSMWQEHPILLILVIVIIASLITRYFVKRIYYKTKLNINSFNFVVRIGITILIGGIYFLMIRGSTGTFPLQKEDMNVSENEFVNTCVTNGLFSLKEAYAEVKKEFKIDHPDDILKNYGFNSFHEAFAAYKDISVDSIKNKSPEELLFKTSHLNQQKKMYNVIYLIMESMSNHFLNFHSEKYNLLGRLEKHFNDDILFRNFQSSSNGTLNSLENIILNSPYHPIFDTKYRFNSYDLSIAKPFKDAGYKTLFVTGIELGWRHLNEALKNQYIDKIYGKKSILRNYPNAKSNHTWGVYDHCVLNCIFDQLSKSDTALFILSLSSTNHTPYELPEDYKPFPIDESISKNPKIIVDKKRCMEILTAYQYSNDALGAFMDKIKSSDLAKNTIVIITGDHNNRSLLSYSKEAEMKYKYSVPFYLYVPDELKKELYIDIQRWGSHYDIITSVYPYVLNNIKYSDLGQNLFDKEIPSSEYYSINDAQLLYEEGSNIESINRKIRAREAIVKYYYSSAIYNQPIN
ncbi:MAG: hypothetical protein PWP52_1321 [Bacteroidales bacterium]|nr:hypothetical protein [Bacteroidales bacterium]